jgi:Ser-tRNA(Ala) deacylase AlaX
MDDIIVIITCMRTKQTYYESPYTLELEATVLSVQPHGNLTNVILDQTLFYPEGGGQPSDRGTIGTAKVEYVRFQEGEIIHQVTGEVKAGERVKIVLDWAWRYKHMKIHTAGHLLHDVLMTMVKDLSPLRGGHGKKAFLEYKGELDPLIKERLEVEVNKVAQQELEVTTKETSYDELAKECPFLPPNLPKDKPLRMIKIGDFPSMPDGGVQVRSTGELGKIWIAHIAVKDGITNIRYGVVANLT